MSKRSIRILGSSQTLCASLLGCCDSELCIAHFVPCLLSFQPPCALVSPLSLLCPTVTSCPPRLHSLSTALATDPARVSCTVVFTDSTVAFRRRRDISLSVILTNWPRNRQPYYRIPCLLFFPHIFIYLSSTIWCHLRPAATCVAQLSRCHQLGNPPQIPSNIGRILW